MSFQVQNFKKNKPFNPSPSRKSSLKKLISPSLSRKLFLKTSNLTVLGLTIFSLMTLYAHAGLSFPSQFSKHTFPHLAAASVKANPEKLFTTNTVAVVPKSMLEVSQYLHPALQRLQQENGVSVGSVIIQNKSVSSLSRRQFFSNKSSRGFSPTLGSTLTVFILPIKNSYVSSRFGWRNGKLHAGVDFSSHIGAPIYASATGRVITSGWGNGYGNMVLIDHGNGMKTRYGHCSEVLVQEGAWVTRGQLIAKVGNTGHSTGPHLHYEVIANDVPRNPEVYLNR